MNADLRTLYSEWNALRCVIACHPRHAPDFAQALRSHVDRWRVAFLATHYPAHEWQVESTTITYPYTLENHPNLPDYITVRARPIVGGRVSGVQHVRTWHAAPDTESNR